MEDMGKYEHLVQSILDELDVDVVGLWTIPEDLQGLFGMTDPGEIRRTTLHIAERLLSHHGVVFGQFEVGFFQPWEQPVPEIVERIDTLWGELGRGPKFLEIGWFAKEGTSSYRFD